MQHRWMAMIIFEMCWAPGSYQREILAPSIEIDLELSEMVQGKLHQVLLGIMDTP